MLRNTYLSPFDSLFHHPVKTHHVSQYLLCDDDAPCVPIDNYATEIKTIVTRIKKVVPVWIAMNNCHILTSEHIFPDDVTAT